MSDGPEWFAPKRYGIGSGRPIAWQGWVVLSAYLAIVAASSLLLGDKPPVALSTILPATALLMVICANTTRGGWRWRWEGRE